MSLCLRLTDTEYPTPAIPKALQHPGCMSIWSPSCTYNVASSRCLPAPCTIKLFLSGVLGPLVSEVVCEERNVKLDAKKGELIKT